jgi:hypothetical protein
MCGDADWSAGCSVRFECDTLSVPYSISGATTPAPAGGGATDADSASNASTDVSYKLGHRGTKGIDRGVLRTTVNNKTF